MNFELINNALCIVSDGEVLVSDVTAYVKYPGNHANVLSVPAEGTWKLDGNTASCDNFSMEMAPCGDGIMVRSTFRNLGDEITVPCDFTAFAGTIRRTPDRMLVNHSVYINAEQPVSICEMQSAVGAVHLVYDYPYMSAENTVFDTVEGDAFIFGAVTYQKYFSNITVAREGVITAFCNTEMHPIQTNGTVTSEWFVLAPCKDCVSGLEQFAQTVAALAGVKRSERENPYGYCSWYYYGGGISEDRMRQNIDVLVEKKDLLPVKYVQIDDGWEDSWGSWQPNEKFGDMKAFADEIKANGFIPGIWVAPFGCSAENQIAKDHPDWFVKNASGEAWQRYSLMFDFTNPEVREYIGSVIRRISYDWGFRYIKLDIITPCLAAGKHFDPDATSLENYRLGLKTVRENATEDTFLLGCTAPFGGAVGYVDGMRVSLDVFERWESIRDVFNAVLKRYYYHRNYYLIDADCLIVRKKENEDEECIRLCTRTDTEIRTYITAMAASGGALMLSDKLPLLSEEQLNLISKLYPLTQESARPLDLMDTHIPGVLDFGKKGAVRNVALINWSDTTRTLSVENDSALVWEFWEKTFCVHEGGTYTVSVPPRTARMLSFTDRDTAAVVGSDAAVVMQSPWTKEKDRISGKRIKTDEEVYIASVSPLRAVDDCDVSLMYEASGYKIYKVTFAKEEYTVEIN